MVETLLQKRAAQLHPSLREFPAKLVRVVDGDTYDVVVDLGYGITFKDRYRHDRVDTWEMYGVEKERGRITKLAVELWWLDRDNGEPWPFTAIVKKTKRGSEARGKYGRWPAEIAGPDGDLLGEFLISGGHESFPLTPSAL